MDKKFDAVVYIGRFQPVHNAHVEMLKRAGELAKKVIVIVGSSQRPRTFKNPWNDRERGAMLTEVMVPLHEKTGAQYVYEFNIDTLYNNDAWVVRVQDIVNKHTNKEDKVGIIGYKKDETSFYLDMFPQWETIPQDLIEELSATEIREMYFSSEPVNLHWFSGVIPPSTMAYLRWFMSSPEYQQVTREKEFIKAYKKQYENAPYPPIFVTTDAVVFQAGHILMVRRRSEPGKGLLAFPGGFLKDTQGIEDSMIRELMEETKIKLPEQILRRNITKTKVFDSVFRSERGRTITHAFKISLTDGEWKLPKVRGADDAEKAMWVPISQVKSEECFEDHYDILQYFLGNK